MKFKDFINTIGLVLFIAGVHTKALDSTYSIVNKVRSTPGKSNKGTECAVAFNSKGKPLIVLWHDPDSPNKIYSASMGDPQWSFEDFNENTQTVSLAVDGNYVGDHLQCASGQDGVTVLPANDYVWTITQNDGSEATYMIQSGHKYWGLSSADLNTRVILGEKTGTDEQSWYQENLLP
ncbi:hypothetical protein K443DRAFT_13795 [Laccaria amethystina LaAM-08-1]|uniref:CCL2-like lectin domain-containing protein n=1 Tax=Laccaria amethystina LaAM-08-1 TaxID=1095629 RepID=A0A0C9WUH9_9AGAR|nr:hypothetical protein K443DRAFT_13795 [Laccaria amethystina LaAM-08-1]